MGNVFGVVTKFVLGRASIGETRKCVLFFALQALFLLLLAHQKRKMNIFIWNKTTDMANTAHIHSTIAEHSPEMGTVTLTTARLVGLAEDMIITGRAT